ncbi:TlpA family protein disulfide reductase [Chitinophaga barathri]|uniref:TlpA family protein disulfide reductase n=1 Tax=Chitinophaga barathri TaxID=1647451 RepID=A0A3N4M5A8_9BACT|nr:TlpA disulfide reductase family protein [Chitinophaga barathri]RPD38115.1 TlpA family protein disulfide reductase [Chitinophaga barathri]
MKAINKIFTLLLLLSVFTAGAQQRVTISPAMPERGQTVTVTFDPSVPGSPIPADAAAVTLNFTYSNFYDLPWKIKMDKKEGKWVTSFKLAKFAAFATFTLISGDAADKPAAGKHYEVAVYENGKPVENGNLYKGYSLSAQLGKSPDLAASQAAQYEKELALYPSNYEAQVRLLQYKMSISEGKDKEKYYAQAHKVIAERFNTAPTVMGNLNKVTMAYLILGERSRVDSIYKVVRERYPNSETGRSLRSDAISKEPDTSRRIALYEAMLKAETPANNSEFSPVHEHLFDLYAARKNEAKVWYHAGKISLDTTNPYLPNTYKSMAQTLLDYNVAPDLARSYAEKALSMADRFPAGIIRHFPETGHIYPAVDDSTRRAVTAKARANMLSILGLLDMKAGKNADAAVRMKEALQTYKDRETLDNVAAFYQMADMKDELASLNALREKDLAARIAAQRVNRPAPSLAAFVDMKGNPLKTEDLKNKVILIDFWATWCIPCMQEMLYIQRLYDQYKNNPDVVFMIVNSGARNTLKDAQGWSGNKKYAFPVYYNTDPEVGEKFKFTIIPATYIIDRKGNIQFGNIGFEGPEVETKLRLQLEQVLKN